MRRLRTLLGRLQPFGGESDDVEGDRGNVWAAIPSCQYVGRRAEAGGIAREEQERAVTEVTEQAEREEEIPEWEVGVSRRSAWCSSYCVVFIRGQSEARLYE
jgi:hypothetical protein